VGSKCSVVGVNFEERVVGTNSVEWYELCGISRGRRDVKAPERRSYCRVSRGQRAVKAPDLPTVRVRRELCSRSVRFPHETLPGRFPHETLPGRFPHETLPGRFPHESARFARALVQSSVVGRLSCRPTTTQSVGEARGSRDCGAVRWRSRSAARAFGGRARNRRGAVCGCGAVAVVSSQSQSLALSR
jgi:hypothetical protein